MLDVEAALARATAPASRRRGDRGRLSRARRFDADALAAEAERHASPVVGLVAALRAAVGPEHAEFVHLGATSQDILDTAVMLVARRAHRRAGIDAARRPMPPRAWRPTHRDTPMLGAHAAAERAADDLRAEGGRVGRGPRRRHRAARRAAALGADGRAGRRPRARRCGRAWPPSSCSRCRRCRGTPTASARVARRRARRAVRRAGQGRAPTSCCSPRARWGRCAAATARRRRWPTSATRPTRWRSALRHAARPASSRRC